MKKLFVICPECFLEDVIRDYAQEEVYFISELGGCLTLDFESLEHLYLFIQEHQVKELYLVNCLECDLLKNILEQMPFRKTEAEKYFYNLYMENLDEFLLLEDNQDKRKKLVELNIQKQKEVLGKSAYFNEMIDSGDLLVKGLIIHKEQNAPKLIEY